MKQRLVLLYDDHCPLCQWYSACFVQLGLLPDDGRQALGSYSPATHLPQPDMQRAQHEIPLVDAEANTVRYGIDALLTILEQRYAGLVRVARFPFVYAALQALYAFISYNRRIIAGASACTGACRPDYHAGWRLTWLVFCITWAVILTMWAGHLVGEVWLGTGLSVGVSLAAIGGGWLLYMLSLVHLPRQQAVDYLGHLGTMMLVGVLLLVPACLCATLIATNSRWRWCGSVLLSFGTMTAMHWRRLRACGLPVWRLYLWVACLLLTASTCLLLLV